MKVLREMCLSILIAVFLLSGVTYAQNPAKESYDKGMEYAIQGEFKKAKEEFEKALQVDPVYEPAEICLQIIKQIIERKEVKMSRETAISFFKDASNALIGQNYQAIKAISDCNKAIEINPKDAEAYYKRGFAYVQKGQYDQGISDCNKAIEINPKYAEAYCRRGWIYLKILGNKVKGCADCKKACELGDCRYYNLAKQKGDCP